LYSVEVDYADTTMDYPLKTTEQLRQQFRSLRKKRRLTQASLGMLIGVTQARVVEIEANPGSVSLQQIMQVLNALGAGFVIRDTQADSASNEGSRLRQEPDAALSVTGYAPTIKIKKGSW
jgi:HTH-type transcriptional regulator/antitoxin HipB